MKTVRTIKADAVPACPDFLDTAFADEVSAHIEEANNRWYFVFEVPDMLFLLGIFYLFVWAIQTPYFWVNFTFGLAVLICLYVLYPCFYTEGD